MFLYIYKYTCVFIYLYNKDYISKPNRNNIQIFDRFYSTDINNNKKLPFI